MKGGLCFIYTSLLTISVISSCILFILVVSEGIQDPNSEKVDLSGLHNVSQKVKSVSDDVHRTTVRPEHSVEELPKVNSEEKRLGDEMTFAEALSLNSVTTEGLPDTGQPPLVISLGDGVKLELDPDQLFAEESEQHNDTTAFTIVDTHANKEETHVVFKAKPAHEPKQDETTTTAPEEEKQSQQEPSEAIQTKPVTPPEDIPSFSEWAQKQLAEAEKKDTVLNHSSQPSHSNTNFSSKSTKVRSKNYASPACGAKVVAVNPEAGSPSSILSPNRDEYMLNSCNSRIWFVVELCEAVQAQKIEIANFELFSSTPKEFSVYFSDRFPTREWASVGQFTAKDMRDVQSFDLYPHLFGKFIKVELLSHHGAEHYCPISLFKVYGTSEFEVLEKENAHAAQIEDEDDEIIDVPDIPTAEAEPSKNLFGSARDAVMSIMKKAAQALGKTEVPKNVSSAHNDSSIDKMYKRCCTPSHIIVCDNCSDTLYNEVFQLISCHSDRLSCLVRQPFLRDTLKSTDICLPFGLDFKSTKTIEFNTERVSYLNALFSPKYLVALCNILAIKEKKVVLNTSFATEFNVTTNITFEEVPQIDNPVNNSDQVVIVPNASNNSDDIINETLKAEDSVVTSTEKTVPVDLPSEEIVDTEKREENPTAAEEKPAQETDKNPPENEKVPEQITEPEKNGSTPKTDPRNGKSEVVAKAKEPNAEETVTDTQIENDSFGSDFDQMAVDPTPAGVVPSAAPNQNQATTIPKESVFLRLSNRVKTLERNMSLSGQYLEELSRRYKKQVEEMQKTFEKTVQQMTEERKKSNEREQKYLEQMNNLQNQLSQMATALNMLMDEHNSWFGNITFFKFIVFQSIIIGAVFYYVAVTKKRTVEPVVVPIPKKIKKKDKLRRKSVEGVSGHATPSAKQRRPSEEALHIARLSAEESRDEDDGEWQIARRNRRRKTSIIHRANNGWARQDSIGALRENPIPLDEEEFIAPVSEPVEFNGVNPPQKEIPKTNSFFNNLKNKTMKTRRLSSPAFLRTLSRQSTRSTPSPTVRTEINGIVQRKAASESPTGSLWSESTEVSQNGQDNMSGGKKKKSFKTILKKVF